MSKVVKRETVEDWVKFTMSVQAVYKRARESRLRRGNTFLWVHMKDLACKCPKIKTNKFHQPATGPRKKSELITSPNVSVNLLRIQVCRRGGEILFDPGKGEGRRSPRIDGEPTLHRHRVEGRVAQANEEVPTSLAQVQLRTQKLLCSPPRMVSPQTRLMHVIEHVNKLDMSRTYYAKRHLVNARLPGTLAQTRCSTRSASLN
uniref:Netrin module non-TIMP type domain-containing protein n=1 Tax=Timema cristinae TaxID=61476 RepID=A0A7R9DHC1_TIMCR|nr:unnamed protein product [Timema cristinae]